MKINYNAFCLIGFIIIGSSVLAETVKIERKQYQTQRAEPSAPVLDGSLDDAVWDLVEWGSDFTQRSPSEGSAPSQKTAFKILYDDKNLYVGIRAFDTSPDSIVQRMCRRDGFDGDWVEINIDSYHDFRTAFSFTINAAGVKGDEAITEDGNNWDSDWNPVWYVKTRTDSLGWTAEMRIPFSQLRFAEKDNHVWGIQFTRRLYRHEERSVWQFIPRDARGWVNRFGELHGIKGIFQSRRIELLPYTMLGAETFQKEEGNPFANGRLYHADIGLDAKIGVTSDLTMDLTINPDFGQVEADPSEVNLTAYETFFDEKRPFFIEGARLLGASIMIGNSEFANDKQFYSRRIGRPPGYTPDLNDDEYINMPANSTILGALKLTGKTQKGYSIGVLNAVTSKEVAEVDLNGQRRFIDVEPMSNYFLGRVLKDFRGGQTTFGGMVTSTYRQLTDANRDLMHRSATTGGIDLFHLWKNRTYNFTLNLVYSHVQGSREAILETQTASQRYYQRPDADHITLDSTRTALSGFGGSMYLGKGGGEHFQILAGGTWRSPGLELNDMGFLRRADLILPFIWFQWRQEQPFSVFRQVYINFNGWDACNFGWENLFSGGNIDLSMQFKNQWFIDTGIAYNARSLSPSALRGGPSLRFPPSWQKWFYISTDNRKAYQLSLSLSDNKFTDQISNSYNISPGLLLRPSDAFSFSFYPFYDYNRNDLQYVETIESDSDNHYVFGRINQKTLGMVIRFTYCITPDLTIQFYGMPFVSAGTYTHLKEITDPRADVYDDRFHTFSDEEINYLDDDEIYQVDLDRDENTDYTFDKPDFNFRQFRSNLVIRWEYTPGSTLYLVWSQNRTGFENMGDFSIGGDMRDLFDVPPHNVILLKLNKWFSI